MLAESGFDSDIANNAQEAEALLAEHHYEAMTLDIMLSDKNGIDLYKELRKSPITEHLPIIFVSATADKTRVSNAGKSLTGTVDWINKPIDSETLVAAIQKGISQFENQNVKRILHVEDDADISELVKILLDDSYDITVAGSLNEAKIALAKGRFDLVLLDIGLPDGSGLDLIPDIRKLKHSPEIIVFSADDLKIKQNPYVAESLIKSKTTNEELISKIKDVIT